MLLVVPYVRVHRELHGELRFAVRAFRRLGVEDGVSCFICRGTHREQ